MRKWSDRKDDVLVGLHVDNDFNDKLNSFVRLGRPGDQFYFATKSAFFRVALLDLMSRIEGIDPDILQRMPMQPVAPQASALPPPTERKSP
ncbi:hypothetical protein GOA63_16385 [Sinorhizobium meliloti]|uniref:hypothetical protein n=1 Tax=Rhizobium meliloti TaxID=382 RepID=UPI00129571C4|nr:hypothetical protein [Sinorhizobium meliloti]MDW9593784.1 hypothetical protein [Sinorhizobium meliloti]MDX0188856.1 hypothetical protein [Sinorhizobium meliloti]MQV10090.1 hypothetical protein [Sinorhizobium meliloti]MQV59228.1 hypothetical protein [Sinorhizobium meliloti]